LISVCNGCQWIQVDFSSFISCASLQTSDPYQRKLCNRRSSYSQNFWPAQKLLPRTACDICWYFILLHIHETFRTACDICWHFILLRIGETSGENVFPTFEVFS
jgi:hypothetical protein